MLINYKFENLFLKVLFILVMLLYWLLVILNDEEIVLFKEFFWIMLVYELFFKLVLDNVVIESCCLLFVCYLSLILFRFIVLLNEKRI